MQHTNTTLAGSELKYLIFPLFLPLFNSTAITKDRNPLNDVFFKKSYIVVIVAPDQRKYNNIILLTLIIIYSRESDSLKLTSRHQVFGIQQLSSVSYQYCYLPGLISLTKDEGMN